MKVLVDTCVWSQVLRHKSPDNRLTKKTEDLINDGLVVMMGPIRQELLSGIPEKEQFDRLRENLSSFQDITLRAEHFEKAAEFSNRCRSRGIQGSTTDFLICAVAHVEDRIIFTTDSDFENYRKYLPVKLMK